MAISQAGRSARRRAWEIRKVHMSSALKWGGYAAGGAALGSGGLVRDATVSLAAGAVIGVGTAAWRARRPSGAARWIQGAKAEERTARILKPLRRQGWWVTHDLKIPKSKANLDHVAVHPSGAFLVYIDTKAWHMKSSGGQPADVKWVGRRLMYGGRFDNTSKMRTVEWEAERLAAETGLPVVPVIAVDGARVVGIGGQEGFLKVEDTYIVGVGLLLDLLTRMGEQAKPSPRQVAKARKAVERKFIAA